MNTKAICSLAFACLLASAPTLNCMNAVKSWFQNPTFSFTGQLSPAISQELFDASKQWVNDHKDALFIAAIMSSPVILLGANLVYKKLRAKPKAKKTLVRDDASNSKDTTVSKAVADDSVKQNGASGESEQKDTAKPVNAVKIETVELPSPKQAIIQLFRETLAGKADRTVILRQIINRCSSRALEKAFGSFMIAFRAYKNGQGEKYLEEARTIATSLIEPLLDQVENLDAIIAPSQIQEWLKDGFYRK
jgi:hypothetical protein